jgi:hypothetical protein
VRGKSWILGTVVLAGAAAVASNGGAQAATVPVGGAPTFTPPIHVNDPNAGPVNPTEPATIVGKDGTRYVAYQGGSNLMESGDGGRSWKRVDAPNVVQRHLTGTGCVSRADAGDVDLAIDQTGRMYFATLQQAVDVGTNGAGVGFQVGIVHSDDHFKDATTSGTCAGHQPFMIDREWLAAYTPPGQTADHSRAYVAYHDFGPDTMWVNSSADGGKTWGTPVNIITAADAINNSFCDTVPASIAVDPRNGWVYVAWTAGPNAAFNAATGCNETQGTVFNNFYVALSKDNGATWTQTLAFSGQGPTDANPLDMSEIFGSMVLDRQGGVYIAFPAFLNGEFGAYYAYSKAPGADGKLTFSKPVKVNGPDVHSAYFVRAIAGDEGRAAITFVGTPAKNVVATPSNKQTYSGADAKLPNCRPEVGTEVHGVRFPGKPCMLPKDSPWFIYVAQTSDGTSASPTFQVTRLRNDPMHIGDICTLGIFCLTDDNRDLADTNDIKLDATGGIQVAYTYETPDSTRTYIDFQCQQGGVGLYADVDLKPCQPVAASVGTAVSVQNAKVLGARAGRLPATGRSQGYALPAVLTAAAGLAGVRMVRRRRVRSAS